MENMPFTTWFLSTSPPPNLLYSWSCNVVHRIFQNTWRFVPSPSKGGILGHCDGELLGKSRQRCEGIDATGDRDRPQAVRVVYLLSLLIVRFGELRWTLVMMGWSSSWFGQLRLLDIWLYQSRSKCVPIYSVDPGDVCFIALDRFCFCWESHSRKG